MLKRTSAAVGGVFAGISAFGVLGGTRANPGGDSPQAMATLPNQETDGESVTVSMVNMPEGGYVSIHDLQRFDPETDPSGNELLGHSPPEHTVLQSIIGITDFLEPGMHNDVTVPLFGDFATFEADAALHNDDEDPTALARSQPLIVIPHLNADDTGDRFQEDPDNPGELLEIADPNLRDIPYLDGRSIVDTLDPVVNDIARVALEGDDEENVEEAQTLTQQIRQGVILPRVPDLDG